MTRYDWGGRWDAAELIARHYNLPEVVAALRMDRRSANAVLNSMSQRGAISFADGPMEPPWVDGPVVTLPEVHDLSLEQVDAIAFLLRYFPEDLEPKRMTGPDPDLPITVVRLWLP